MTFPSSKNAWPERQGVPHAAGDQLFRARSLLVIKFHGAVAVERQTLASGIVSVDDTVADNDAGAAVTVVVTVDREDGVVRLRDGGGVGE